jgi:hypothetical protein
MKLIHRASSIFAAGLMTSQLHHSAGWHCIKRLQRQLYLIARTTDETFCLAAKTLQKLQILSSLSLSFSLSVCLKNCQEIASYSNFSKASLHADPVIKMAFHADNLPCSMEVISWDLPEGFCSLINCFTIYSCRAPVKDVLVSVCQHQSQV